MLSGDEDVETVWEAISDSRLAPYNRLSSDRREALDLYAWNTRTSAAVFELVGHLEVLLRNGLDRCLQDYFSEDARGIPWFMLQTAGGEHVTDAVEVVRTRLRAQEQGPKGRARALRETRDQIVAGLSFGFWSGLLGPKYEDLWRDCLHRAFPHSSGRRKDVAAALEHIRKLRNRLAHHDSLINVDIPFEVRRIVQVASYLSPEAGKWLESQSRAMDTYAERPGRLLEDTVVVAARDAWQLYSSTQCSAYVCQAGRAFRPVKRIAFYADREIKKEIPSILYRRDDVEWTPEETDRLGASDDRWDRKIANVIKVSRGEGWAEGRYQVFLLSRAGDPQHRQLSAALSHQGAGRGSAFTQRQRYVSLHALETASSTSDLT
ncbi:hypothetical protein ACWC9T_25340 [Kitasatospora sp. NPDC001159]